MPTPHKGEKQDDFVSRCIPIVMDEGTAEDNDQAAAICFSMWREAHKDGHMAKAKTPAILAISAPVEILAGDADKKGPRQFQVQAYNGGALEIPNWPNPVVVDLSGMTMAKSIVANLHHDRKQIVGHSTEQIKDNKHLVLKGSVSGAGPAAQEVIAAHDNGFPWQASIEAKPQKLEEVKAGKSVTVNGQTFEGPVTVARKSQLYGIAFLPHGADDGTSVTIAATAALKEHDMNPELRTWIEAMLPGTDIDSLTPEAVANLEANYKGKNGKPKARAKVDDVLANAKAEEDRREQIANITAQAIADNPGRGDDFINKLELLSSQAIEAKWDPEKYELELLRATRPQAHTVFRSRNTLDGRMTDRVIEAAICMTGRLKDHEKMFDEPTLEAAKAQFKNGIGLKQLFNIAAQANGYHNSTFDVTLDVQRAAFGMTGPRHIQATGFSTINIANVVAATANKFLREGWMAVDLTPLRIAFIRPVRDFKQITTVSLTGHLQFEKLGPAGEIKHGTLADLTYTNQADTYAAMLAITRQDIINDDLGALTAVPRRLGRGGALKLNDIFWTEFLSGVSTSFFASANNNINTGVADMTIGGLAATETIFMNQTDPDGKPLGIMPKIILVPTALKASAVALMDPQGILITGSDVRIPNVNVFKSRFTVESSPYISNSSYTGNTAVAWWMLADPNELPVIEIVALNGRVEPVVETADAEFNVLGVQMRGYSDVGVRFQEKRAGVHADGGAS